MPLVAFTFADSSELTFVDDQTMRVPVDESLIVPSGMEATTASAAVCAACAAVALFAALVADVAAALALDAALVA